MLTASEALFTAKAWLGQQARYHTTFCIWQDGGNP